MENLLINQKSFWIRWYRFIFVLGKDSQLPDNTCQLRKDLILGTLVAILALPLIVLFNLLKFFKKFSQNFFERYILIGFFTIIAIVSWAITGAGKEPAWMGYLTQIIFIAFITLVLLFGAAVASCIEYIENKAMMNSSKKRKVKKPSVFAELYKSAKDKYCKKITYI